MCLNTLTSVIPHKQSQGRKLMSAVLWHEASQSILAATRDELSVVQVGHVSLSVFLLLSCLVWIVV